MSRSDPKRITIDSVVGFVKIVELSEPSLYVFPSVGLFNADGKIVVWVPEDTVAFFFRSLKASNAHPKQPDGRICELNSGMSYYYLVRKGNILYVVDRDHGLNTDNARVIINPANAVDITLAMKELA